MVVGRALQDLAYAMRQELVAKKTYQGDSWEEDGYEYVKSTLEAREAFEDTLNKFVEVLANA